ncbi:unnamed protein product [Paramecium sonneborni]|uniref:Protein kinase domain-containing protein n=1 Tax=Paramecium sonneborni TaxID=65129 RepID=A0A8S1PCY0_9CILI|nr:unnamed protein product [Paramecium sonneborni]
MQQKKVWRKIQYDIRDKPILQLKFQKVGKKSNDIYIGCFNEYLIKYKDPFYTIPYKLFDLEFTNKFEVIRTPSKLKQEKPHSKVRGEEILELGEIVAIRLIMENIDKPYEIQGKTDQMHQLRSFLGNKINQIGFHNLFRVYKKIGRGNFASVYLAERIEDNLRMAVKAFSKQIVYNEDKGREGLINEIQIMRELDHPNLMKLYEVYETKNSIYMGLELLEGDQLFEYLKKKIQFTEKQIQSIMVGLLMGLKHMHIKGIMHRDLKLENILFKQQGNFDSVVIADFGLATHINKKPYLYQKCGTPGFVAPEIINLKNVYQPYDSVCDVYSMGVVFYILLTGRPAFTGKTYNTIVKQNKEANVNFDSPLFQSAAKDVQNLIFQMLQKDPSLRIKSSEALLHPYLQSALLIDDDEAHISTDDDPNLMERIKILNKQTEKVDFTRIKRQNSQNIKDLALQGTQELKQNQSSDEELKIVMRTPVITGRINSVDNSPMLKCLSPFQSTGGYDEIAHDQIILQRYSGKTLKI